MANQFSIAFDSGYTILIKSAARLYSKLISIYEKHFNQEKVAYSLVNSFINPDLTYFEECSNLIELWLKSSFQSFVDQLIVQFDTLFFLKWSDLFFVSKSKVLSIFPMVFQDSQPISFVSLFLMKNLFRV
jgi:hypothetical protein